MRLIIEQPKKWSPPYAEERDPTPERIEQLVRDLAWKEITFVVLKKDDGDWIECSGAHQDGFSVIFQEKGVGFITADEPTGLEQIVLVLQDYAIGGSLWQELYAWDDFPTAGRR